MMLQDDCQLKQPKNVSENRAQGNRNNPEKIFGSKQSKTTLNNNHKSQDLSVPYKNVQDYSLNQQNRIIEGQQHVDGAQYDLDAQFNRVRNLNESQADPVLINNQSDKYQDIGSINKNKNRHISEMNRHLNEPKFQYGLSKGYSFLNEQQRSEQLQRNKNMAIIGDNDRLFKLGKSKKRLSKTEEKPVKQEHSKGKRKIQDLQVNIRRSDESNNNQSEPEINLIKMNNQNQALFLDDKNELRLHSNYKSQQSITSKNNQNQIRRIQESKDDEGFIKSKIFISQQLLKNQKSSLEKNQNKQDSKLQNSVQLSEHNIWPSLNNIKSKTVNINKKNHKKRQSLKLPNESSNRLKNESSDKLNVLLNKLDNLMDNQAKVDKKSDRAVDQEIDDSQIKLIEILAFVKSNSDKLPSCFAVLDTINALALIKLYYFGETSIQILVSIIVSMVSVFLIAINILEQISKTKQNEQIELLNQSNFAKAFSFLTAIASLPIELNKALINSLYMLSLFKIAYMVKQSENDRQLICYRITFVLMLSISSTLLIDQKLQSLSNFNQLGIIIIKCMPIQINLYSSILSMVFITLKKDQQYIQSQILQKQGLDKQLDANQMDGLKAQSSQQVSQNAQISAIKNEIKEFMEIVKLLQEDKHSHDSSEGIQKKKDVDAGTETNLEGLSIREEYRDEVFSINLEQPNQKDMQINQIGQSNSNGQNDIQQLNFKDSYIQSQATQAQILSEHLIKKLSKNVIVFKIGNEQVDQQLEYSMSDIEQQPVCLDSKGLSQNRGFKQTKSKFSDNMSKKSNQKLSKKSQIEIIDISENFFENLPFYEQSLNLQKANKGANVQSPMIHQRQILSLDHNHILQHKDIVNQPKEQKLGQVPLQKSNTILQKKDQANQQQNVMKPFEIQRRSLSRAQSSSCIGKMNNQSVKLTNQQRLIMDLKIFEPYFIQYRNKQEYIQKSLKSSINDVLKRFLKSNKKQRMQKLFFKINLKDNFPNHKNSSQVHRMHNDIKNDQDKDVKIKSCKLAQKNKDSFLKDLNDSIKSNENNDQDKIVFDINIEQRDLQNNHERQLYVDDDLEKSMFQDSESSISSRFSQRNLKDEKRPEDQIHYFEFELNFMGEIQINQSGQQILQDSFYLNIKDISQIIKNQKQLSDSIYLEAIEGNFSHNQMTPLNYLMESSSIINDKVFQLFQQNQQIIQKLKSQVKKDPNALQKMNLHKQLIKEVFKKNDVLKRELLNKSDDNDQLVNSLWFLNQAQINRMEIHQNKFKATISEIDDISHHINKTFKSFKKHISGKNLNVYVAYRDLLDQSMQADWDNFSLILYNLLKNAIIHNEPDGEIYLILTKKKYKKTRSVQQLIPQNPMDEHSQISVAESNYAHQFQDYILEVEIIDTGEGIHPDRQGLLFIPFLELKQLHGIIKRPKKDTIGLGLSASYEIARKLQGDLKIKQSQQGLTIFQMRFPIKVKSEKNNFKMMSKQCLDKDLRSFDGSPYGGQQKRYRRMRHSSFSLDQSQYDSLFVRMNTKVYQIYGEKRENYRPQLSRYLQAHFQPVFKQQIVMNLQENAHIEKYDVKNIDPNRIRRDYHLNQLHRQNNKRQNISHSLDRQAEACDLQLPQNQSIQNSVNIQINLNNQGNINERNQYFSLENCEEILKQIDRNELNEGSLLALKQRFFDRELQPNLPLIPQIDEQNLSNRVNQRRSFMQNFISSQASLSQRNILQNQNENMNQNLLNNLSSQFDQRNSLSNNQQNNGNQIHGRMNAHQNPSRQSDASNMNMSHQLNFGRQINQKEQVIALVCNSHQFNAKPKFKSAQQKNDKLKQKKNKSKVEHNSHNLDHNAQELNENNENVPKRSMMSQQINEVQPIIDDKKGEINNQRGQFKVSHQDNSNKNQKSDQKGKDLSVDQKCLQELQESLEDLIILDLNVNEEDDLSDSSEENFTKKLKLQSLQEGKNNIIQKLQQKQILKDNYYQLPDVNKARKSNQNDRLIRQPYEEDKEPEQNQNSQFRNVQGPNVVQSRLQQSYQHTGDKYQSSQERVKRNQDIENFENQNKFPGRSALEDINENNNQQNENLGIVQREKRKIGVESDRNRQEYPAAHNSCDDIIVQGQVYEHSHSIKLQKKEQKKSKNSIKKVQLSHSLENLSFKIDQMANSNEDSHRSSLGPAQSNELEQEPHSSKSDLDDSNSFDNDQYDMIVQPQHPQNLSRKRSIPENQSQPPPSLRAINVQDFDQPQQRYIDEQQQAYSNQIQSSPLDGQPQEENQFILKNHLDQNRVQQNQNARNQQNNQLKDDSLDANNLCECKPSILIVDDDIFNLQIQQELIEQAIKEKISDNQERIEPCIKKANDGNVAVEMVKNCLAKRCQCENRVFKLIVMDIQMKKMDGNDAAKKIRRMISEENDKSSNKMLTCNIVACTANITLHQLAIESGMLQVYKKPLLRKTVQQMLDFWFYSQYDSE